MSRAIKLHPPEEDLHAYLDRELTRPQVEQLESHLGSCPTCSEKLASLRLLFSQIDSLSESPLKVDLVPRVLQTLEAHELRKPHWGWMLAAQVLVFSAVLILLAGTWLTQAEQMLVLIRHWLGQVGFQAEIGVVLRQIQATIALYKPQIPGVLEISIPRLFTPSQDFVWALVGLVACLVWIMANRWLLARAYKGEINQRQGI